MELRQLRYFIAVAETGSFSRAAEILHVSQPPLSVQIKRLEDELGVRLLDRTTRGASLTVAGRAFFMEARTALARLEHAKNEALRADRGDIGMLSIGFVSIVDYGILPPALKSFSANYPLVEVQLYELTTDAQIRELRASRLDLGVGLGPVREPDIQFERLLYEDLVLAVPASHPVAKQEVAIDLRALSKENFIATPRDAAAGLYDLIHDHCRSFGFTPRITQHARQMQTVISLVSSGMGVALVPSSVRNLKRSGVEYRRLRGKAARVELGILLLQSANTLLKDHFIEALRSSVR